MSDMIILLVAPFVVCLILTGIHCYLGLHVVSRGVIFVDLALAQIAALGTTIALLAGHELNSQPAYFFWGLIAILVPIIGPFVVIWMKPSEQLFQSLFQQTE